MIDLGRAPFHAESVTLFFDHADPRRFHYLPDAPRLRTRDDGKPDLSLLKYRLDPALHEALGAGMLSLTVDLGVDDARLLRLSQLLVQKLSLDGPALLGPVSPDAGHCQVVIIDKTSDDAREGGASGFGLVQRIVGATAPSLYGDEAATFMAALSAEGAATIEGALRQGTLPVGVVYGLQVLGLRPALRARITARWADAYRYYENRLHGGKLLLAVDVGATVQSLVHDEVLKVEIDELVPEAERQASWDRAVDNAQRYVMETLFVPTLGSAPPAAGGHGDALQAIGDAIKDIAGFFSFTYSLKQIDRSELKTLTYELNVAAAETLTLSPQGTLSSLSAGLDVDGLITVVEPAAADDMRFDVGVLCDLLAAGIERLEVTLRYGDRSVPLTLDAKTPRAPANFFYAAASGRAVRFRYAIHFLPGAGTTDVIESGEVATEDRVVRIDPRALYRQPSLRLLTQGVPFDRFPTVIVDLRADDPTDGWSLTQTLQLDATHPEAAWTLRASLDAELRFQRRIRYVDAHGGETVVDWDLTPEGTLVVGDPLGPVLDIAILGSARFETEVRRLVVELRPAAHPDQVTTRILDKAVPFATFSLAVPAGESRAWEYRVTVQTVRNEVNEGTWMAGSGSRLVVGESFAQLRRIQLFFVGKSLAALHLFGVKVRFSFDDAEANLHAEDERLITDLGKPLDWSYPVADLGRIAYTWQLTLVHADGPPEVRDPVTTKDLLAICPLV